MSTRLPGVRGERREPGQVRAGDQVPAAAVATGGRYLGNRGGTPSSCPHLFASNHNTSPVCQVSKTLKATLSALLDNVCDGDCNPAPDVASSLPHEPLGASSAPKLSLAKRRANQQETESYYFTVSFRPADGGGGQDALSRSLSRPQKVKEFLSSSSLSSKLQAKHDLLQEAIQKGSEVLTLAEISAGSVDASQEASFLPFSRPSSRGRRQRPVQVSADFILQLSETERRGCERGHKKSFSQKATRNVFREAEKTTPPDSAPDRRRWCAGGGAPAVVCLTQHLTAGAVVILKVVRYFPECSVLARVFGSPDPFPNSATHSSPQI